uniref:dephospho-CoA kinase n=1 Tax=uncultured Draconibacterium sp. TaxID=1573823 RepID=UPI0032171F69
MALIVGITGGIGSGKSVVCSVFKLLGVPVFEADLEAKRLINSSTEIKNGLIDLFGNDIYTQNDTIDRKKLAGIIFNDEVQLKKVNELIHPVVRSEFQKWVQKQNVPYVVHEAAILFESGFYKMMDFTILVSAPEQMRIKRVSSRDNVTAEQVKERIDKQWPNEKKRKLATIEIKNDNKELILPQIIRIDKQLKDYGKIW